ncbi:Uncharacterized membrane protein YphA, DoxX/SURF4 family [Pseudoxanthomonas sp. GM95]|uniref:DoxX family protein n=1 Tax=Pseudoxanthomonas sp. GM95 TaxID=1881043 RepID=UPI0008BDD462|nr:DoxX family protein [Pseudoxanthomonas sp. GM95]SEL10387.1 Uncharacterized membrane protein YphA, DoxX/SURF4 family [Pseudoxanthomonas sp. GM95]
MIGLLREAFTSPWVHWVALLLLCSAYLQGSFDKLRDFPAAVAEMHHFGLRPALPFAALIIAFELAASALVLSGWYRWAGALALGGFTILANFMADRFWGLQKPERTTIANSFFEHWGLTGGFLLVAWHDLGGRYVF